jgi:hypothetical protein
MANTNVPDAVTKLTMDVKQELTIDPRTVGVDTDDELSIKHIAGIESYITTFTWTVAGVTGNMLWNTRVGPMCPIADTTIVPTMYWLPACSFAAVPFKYWRGTVRYRFQICCSEYHKGRLRFVFDPQWVSSLEMNLAYTRIVDLVNERDFTIDVAWANSKGWLQVSPTNSSAFSTTPYVAANNVNYNGVLGVYIENDLTSPNSTVNNDIKINVFMSMCDDFDVAEPTRDSLDSLTFSTQSRVFGRTGWCYH